MLCTFSSADDILVDNLQPVVVDVSFIHQLDVLAGAIVSFKDLHIVLLETAGFLHNAVIGIGNAVAEESLPLRIREGIVVQFL